MSEGLRLVIFDVDGTLVDSQAHILSAMAQAFDIADLPLPDRETVLGVVGLSLDVIFPILAPDASSAVHTKMSDAYKGAYMNMRVQSGTAQTAPFYPGARDALMHLNGLPDVILGVATGKSKRGLDKLIEGHGLEGLFVTQQVADFHPSKPHPSMILQAMSETGAAPQDTVMIGDTSFDMDMAASAGVRGIGVGWGYHGRDRLQSAHHVIDSYDALRPALNEIWGISE